MDRSLGAGLARSDRGLGVESPCTPPIAYAVNALVENGPPVRAEVGRRDGERLRARLPPPNAGGGGDFGRFATLGNGEEVEANASNPVRFWGRGVSGEIEDLVGELKGVDTSAEAKDVEVDANGLLDGGDCDLSNKLGPETEANGELFEAYAMKPLYMQTVSA